MRFISTVKYDGFEGSLNMKSILTLVTDVWFHSRVNPLVHNKIRTVSETLPSDAVSLSYDFCGVL